MEAKKRLAQLIVARFHGAPAAQAAGGGVRAAVPAARGPADGDDSHRVSGTNGRSPGRFGSTIIVGATQLASSASEVRRLILQGGIYIDDVRVEDPYRPGA